ncbi:MAG: efflux RND transporter periplasmic adaptor subunit [Burkholderiaceae bacterium]|nr:efflux RND transporter periplasmic adaptor subunit [Burkholderiaceae bacterium]
MKKRHTSLVVLGLAGAVAAAWWLQNRPAGPRTEQAAAAASAPGGGGSAAASAGGPVPVEVGKVQRQRLEDDVQAVGTLHSNQSVMLRPEVSGRIVALGFADGQRVRRGQLLVQLDDTLQQAQLRQAEAQAGIARTNLQRSRDLVGQGFVSQSVVDQNAAALDVAQAQVALVQAQLGRMKIVAPFDGVSGIRLVNVGDYVKDGADLVGIEDISSLWVDFRLPERYLVRLRPGQDVEVTLDALPGRRLKAQVGALDAQLDANGRSVLVRARLANPDGALRGGMFARARVVFAVREAALMVPEEALVPMGDKQFVVKVVAGEGGAQVSQRLEARIGQRLQGKVELLDGVVDGDLVVLAGQARLMRGDAQPVRVVDISRPGRPGPRAASAPV